MGTGKKAQGGPNSQGHSAHRATGRGKLLLSLGITAAVMVLEIIGGYLTNSLALISDAGHMFTHCFALIVGIGAIMIAQRPPCHHRTYGLYRAEVLGAFINGIFLLLVVAAIIYEAFQRILEPQKVYGLEMLGIALVGLGTNMASMFILRDAHRNDLNIRGVYYHLAADAASSVGVVAAAVAIMYTGWYILDPLVSMGISVLMIVWAVGILKESSKILLQIAPEGLNTELISGELKKRFPQISDINCVHLWTISSDRLVFSAHVSLKDVNSPERLIARMNRFLQKRYNIMESTIQVDPEGAPDACTMTDTCYPELQVNKKK